MFEIALLSILLLVVAVAYMKYAIRRQLLDTVNVRSSHEEPVPRGGGLIMPLAVLCHAAIYRTFDGFVIGLVLVACVSFLDDVRGLANRWRLLVQLVAVVLLVDGMVGFEGAIVYAIVAVVVILGTINAVNFMDGINGITAAFGSVTLATLIYLNMEVPFADPKLLSYSIAGVLVFAFFNFRAKASCFSGDVGSVSLGYLLVYVSLLLLLETGSVAVLALWMVYGVDSVLTILHRLVKREKIFEAHRQHLYQYLANELGWPHLVVSSIYGVLQGAINVLVILNLAGHGPGPVVFLLLTMAGTSLAYLIAKIWVLRRVQLTE